jgi:catalase
MRAAVLLAGILSLGVMSNTCAESIYKWIDSEGVTHFSAQRPAAGIVAERISISSRQTNRQATQARANTSAEKNAAAATRRMQNNEQAAEDKTQAKQDQQTRVENCAKAETRLETYSTSRRLYRMLEDGERDYLTDDELDKARADAQQLVNDWCD